MPAKKYEFLEHTADICVRVYGESLNELFRNSALALFDIIAESKEKIAKTEPKVISVEKSAGNQEELFIAWLNELLSLSDAYDLIFDEFDIKELSADKIRARVKGREKSNFLIRAEVKAATYHELKLEETESGWQAKVIFDV